MASSITPVIHRAWRRVAPDSVMMMYAEPHIAAITAASWVRYLRTKARLSFAPTDDRWGGDQNGPDRDQCATLGDRHVGIRRHILIQPAPENVDLRLKCSLDLDGCCADRLHDLVKLLGGQGVQVGGDGLDGLLNLG